jgi:hypothetical protein
MLQFLSSASRLKILLIYGMSFAFILLPINATNSAIFVQNYSAWQNLSPAHQNGYVIAYVDTQSTLTDPRETSFANGILGCFQELRPNSTMIVQQVNDTYRSNPDLWGIPAAVIVHVVLMRVCERQLRNAGWDGVTAEVFLQNLRRR